MNVYSKPWWLTSFGYPIRSPHGHRSMAADLIQWRSQAPFGVKTSSWPTATWSGARRPSPCHAAVGFFSSQRWGGNNDFRGGEKLENLLWSGFCNPIVRPGFGMFWKQRWIDFVNISPFSVGEGCLYRANGSDFLNGLTLNSEAELGWDAKTRKYSSPLKVEQNCPALWRIKGPKVPHFRRGIPLGRT